MRERFIDALRWLARTSDVSRERFPDVFVYWRARAMRLLILVGLLVNVLELPLFLLSRAPAGRLGSLLGTMASLWLLFRALATGPRGMRWAGLVLMPLWLGLMAGACYLGNGVIDSGAFAGLMAILLGAMLLGVPGIVAGAVGYAVITAVIAVLMAQGRLPGPEATLRPATIAVLASVNISGMLLLSVLLASLSWLLQRLITLREIADARATELSELDAAKTVFLQNMSHEFRQPITLALAPIEDRLRQTDRDPPDLRRAHQVVRRSLRRLLRLVGSLLDFAAIQAGGMAVVREPEDLPALTRALAGEFVTPVETAGLTLHIDCPSMDAPVWVDRRMWETIVLNLLSNALKFTMRGEIAVSLRRLDGHVELRVRDSGCGIAKEDQALLFQRFQRLEPREARSHEGSGIGLALVADLVKLHGGAIGVESELGQGATFWVRLPLRPPAPDAAQGAPGKRRPRAESVTSSAYVDEAMAWIAPVPRSGPYAALPADEAPPDAEHAAPAAPAAAPATPAATPPSATPAPTPAATPPSATPAPSKDPRPLVLLADDNADMRAFLAEKLSERFRVRAVPDGQAALEAVAEEPPDLVLSDVMMPRLDGIRLVRELRRRPRTAGLPIVLISARASHGNAIEGLEAQADDYIVKPFSVEELVARVRVHVELHRSRRDAAVRQDLFVRMLVHELRGPLTVIKGSTDLLLGRVPPKEEANTRLLRHTKGGIGRMEALLTELADAARVQAGGFQINPEPFDLAELCIEAADEQEMASEREVTLDVPSTSVTVNGDRERIGQVLANLLGNAVKYDPSGRPVHLSLHVLGDEAIVTVRDHGIGIAQDELERVFEANYRTQEARRLARGVGLGLFLCRHIVQLHGGRISARREEDGTSFELALRLPGKPAGAGGERGGDTPAAGAAA